MIWLTWRQHRIEALAIGILLLLFAAVLLITGEIIALEMQKPGPHADVVSYAYDFLQNSYFDAFCVMLPITLPVLAGMFIGAPIMAREFEQGTYCLIWTQSLSWRRWFYKKITLLCCMISGGFGLLFVFFFCWDAAVAGSSGRNFVDFSSQFDGWGFVSIAYALFALFLGIFTGTVLRKTVPAMAVTLLIFIGVRASIESTWRPNFLPPVIATTAVDAPLSIPNGSLVIRVATLNKQGQDAMQVCADALPSNPDSASMAQFYSCMKANDFKNQAIYQPVDRFWLFQGIESAIYLALSGLLALLTFGWIKFRVVGT